MNFPGPVFCSSYHEFVQSNGRVRGYKRRDLRSSSRKGGTRPKSVFPCREICQVCEPKKGDPKNEISYLLLNEVLHTSLTMKLFDPKLMKKFLWLQWLMVFLVEFHTRVDLLTVLTYLGKLGALNSTARTKECKHRGASKTSEKK